MWTKNAQVNIISYSLDHIEGSIFDECNQHGWSFSRIYGYLEEVNKRKTWPFIQELTKRDG